MKAETREWLFKADLRPALARLTDYSIGYRYPGMDADQSMSDEAFQDASSVFVVFRAVLARL